MSRLSAPCVRGLQQVITEVPRYLGRAHQRVVIGDFFEEATRVLFPGAVRHQTDNRADACPDLSLGTMHIEVKSVGAHGQLLVWAHRLYRDRHWAARGNGSLVVWRHNAALPDFATAQQVRAAAASGAFAAYVIDWAAMERWCLARQPVLIDYRPGQSLPAWRISAGALRALAGGAIRAALPPVEVYGHAVQDIEVRGAVMPSLLTPAERAAAAYMRDELFACRLDVVLAPAPRALHCGHMVRQVQGHNPAWYQALAADLPPAKRRRARRRRYHDSSVRRRWVLACLDRLASGRVTGRLVRDVLPHVRSYAESFGD